MHNLQEHLIPALPHLLTSNIIFISMFNSRIDFLKIGPQIARGPLFLAVDKNGKSACQEPEHNYPNRKGRPDVLTKIELSTMQPIVKTQGLGKSEGWVPPFCA